MILFAVIGNWSHFEQKPRQIFLELHGPHCRVALVKTNFQICGLNKFYKNMNNNFVIIIAEIQHIFQTETIMNIIKKNVL